MGKSKEKKLIPSWKRQSGKYSKGIDFYLPTNSKKKNKRRGQTKMQNKNY